MKKLVSVVTSTLLFLLLLSPSPGLAFSRLSPAEASRLMADNPAAVVVDVRSNIDYCYYGHIPCALNLAWKSEFTQKYKTLPTDVPIITVCQHGIRGAAAASFLDQHGYTLVNNITGGMTAWESDGFAAINCQDENPDDCIKQQKRLYFPHIASGNGWETEIAVINLNSQGSLTGTIHAFDAEGQQVGAGVPLKLAANGRRQFTIGSDFSQPEKIAYLYLSSNSSRVYGYLKFFSAPQLTFRAAIPAPRQINQAYIALSHIVISDNWWTGLSLLNTSDRDRNLEFTFNTGLRRSLTLAAGTYRSISLAELIGQVDHPAAIKSAVISGGEGVTGLEIFGHDNQLGGISLSDQTALKLYYPYIVDNDRWWTGMVIFNPGADQGTITVKPFKADGTPLEISRPEIMSRAIYPAPDPGFPIPSRSQLAKTSADFGLPAESGWMMVESTVPVTGFELFGTVNNNLLAGYTATAIEATEGVFPKLEADTANNIWTGIALVNTSANSIFVNLEAYDDAGGEPLAAIRIPLAGHERLLGTPEKIFEKYTVGGPIIKRMTHILYYATGPVVSFQLNGSGPALDALPGR